MLKRQRMVVVSIEKRPSCVNFNTKYFVVQNKHITFEPRSSSSLQGIAKASFVSALASSVGCGVNLMQYVIWSVQ